MLALGVAFRSQGVPQIPVDIIEGVQAPAIENALQHAHFVPRIADVETCERRLRTGKTNLVIAAQPSKANAYEFIYDPSRRESLIARDEVKSALERAAGRRDVSATTDIQVTEPGSRYIDFVVPGLIGASLMGGGLYGVAFVAVDMRLRKLLKRLVATPMRKSDFLLGIVAGRLIFKITEIAAMLLCAYLVFNVVIRGSIIAVTGIALLGAFTFSAIGLLVGSRARRIESVSGLMNLVMMPMYILSGVFFSPDRFPAVIQPVVKILPLTPLIDALRAVMLEGTSVAALWPEVAMLSAWCLATFALALRWFAWE
jgi:ABC-type multidrug transport system permease subunit